MKDANLVIIKRGINSITDEDTKPYFNNNFIFFVLNTGWHLRHQDKWQKLLDFLSQYHFFYFSNTISGFALTSTEIRTTWIFRQDIDGFRFKKEGRKLRLLKKRVVYKVYKEKSKNL